MQKSRRRKKKSKVNVVAPQVQQAYGDEPATLAGNLEASYLTLLGLVFLVIMLEGIFIAVSVSSRSYLGLRYFLLSLFLHVLKQMMEIIVNHQWTCRASSQRAPINLLRM